MAFVDGVDTSADGTKVDLSGTSFGAPQVSAVIALLQESYPEHTPQTLADAIRESAVTAQTMPKLSNGDQLNIYWPNLIGKGAMNSEGAFHKLSE